MSHRLAVVGDPSVTVGFRLAGFRPHTVESRERAARVIADLVEEPEWGVILVQEDLMPDLASMSRRSSGLPVLVPFPPPSRERAPGEAERYVSELLRQAVGYRVRLR